MRTENSNFTIEGLVTKYLNYVEENCPKGWGFDGEKEHEYPEHADREQQLLVILYIRVAGENADNAVINSLSEYIKDYNDLYSKALSNEELWYLCDHFSEVSEYLFSFRKKWWRIDHLKDPFTLEKYNLVKENITPKDGDSVFVANNGFSDIASLFKGCTVFGFTGGFYSDKECWALGQIRLFAAGIKSEIVSGERINDSYSYPLPEKKSFDYIITQNDSYLDIFSKPLDLCLMYDSLKPGGRMLVFDEMMIGKSDFRELIVKEKAVSTIISFKDDIPFLGSKRVGYTLLIIDKFQHDIVEIISLSTNRRKTINADSLSASCFCPGYYMVERPSNGIPLSKIAKAFSLREELSTFKKQLGGKIKYDKENERIILPEWMLSLSVASLNDLSTEFKDANLCNKSLLKVSDPSVDKLRIRIRCVDQPCVMLETDGISSQRLRVGFFDKVPQNTFARLTSSSLNPKGNIDVRYLAALLLYPEVSEQILSICDGDPIGSYIRYLPDLVIVPKHNKTERYQFLTNALDNALKSSQEGMRKAFEEKLESKKMEYINEVRMRKHDMGQYIFEMFNIEDMMRYYLENKEKEEDFCEEIATLLDNLKCSLSELNSLLKNLSQEEQFNKPDNNFDINSFLSHLKDRHKTENFKISYECDMQSVKDWYSRNIMDDAVTKEQNIKISLTPPLTQMSSSDFARMTQNILDNARKHGFTDHDRNDYEVRVNLSIDNKDNMYQIDFLNNGNPLPQGLDKTRYGLRGEKAGNTGGSGIGGNYVRSFVEHYNGDYDVFMNESWVVIRILIPIR